MATNEKLNAVLEHGLRERLAVDPREVDTRNRLAQLYCYSANSAVVKERAHAPRNSGGPRSPTGFDRDGAANGERTVEVCKCGVKKVTYTDKVVFGEHLYPSCGEEPTLPSFSLSFTLSRFHSLSLSLSFSLSFILSHFHSLSLSLSLTFFLSLSHFLSLISFSHFLSHLLSFSITFFLSLSRPQHSHALTPGHCETHSPWYVGYNNTVNIGPESPRAKSKRYGILGAINMEIKVSTYPPSP